MKKEYTSPRMDIKNLDFNDIVTASHDDETEILRGRDIYNTNEQVINQSV